MVVNEKDRTADSHIVLEICGIYVKIFSTVARYHRANTGARSIAQSVLVLLRSNRGYAIYDWLQQMMQYLYGTRYSNTDDN